jgi:hypothetical protein
MMKIVNNLNKRVDYRDIKIGECFMYDNSLCLKIQPAGNNVKAVNSVCFMDNALFNVMPDTKVTPVEATITISSKG